MGWLDWLFDTLDVDTDTSSETGIIIAVMNEATETMIDQCHIISDEIMDSLETIKGINRDTGSKFRK